MKYMLEADPVVADDIIEGKCRHHVIPASMPMPAVGDELYIHSGPWILGTARCTKTFTSLKRDVEWDTLVTFVQCDEAALRTAIIGASVSLRKLAAEAGVAVSTISRFIQGRDLSLRIATKLCRVLSRTAI